MEDATFKKFYTSLGNLGNVPDSEIVGSEELKTVVEGIEEILGEQEQKFFELSGISREDVRGDLESYFGPIFDNPPLDLCERIKGATGDFFFIRKSYQLSHIRKQLDGFSKDKAGFRNYYFAQLFTDYLETLNNRIQGFHQSFYLEPGEVISNSQTSLNNFFKWLFSQDYFKETLQNLDLLSHLKDIRNAISHGGWLTNERDILFIPKENARDAINHEKPTQIDHLKQFNFYPWLRSIMVFLVLLSSEIDVRIFRLALLDKIGNWESWREYVEEYKKGWEAQQAHYNT